MPRGYTRGRTGDGRRQIPDSIAMAELATAAWQPAAEFGMLLADPIYWGWGAPRGDGRAVLVLPGLLGGDAYLRPLRDWLRRIGYTPVKSGIDRNPGWSEELVADLGEIAARAAEQSRRPVVIIGHSMGGILGRSVAVRRPELVEHVIALGSPLGVSRSRLPDAVRMTAIYSQGDRIVRHPWGMDRDGRTENIEVRGSHTGLAFNPEVYRHLARLLPTKAV